MTASHILGTSWLTITWIWLTVLLSGILRGFSGFGFALAASPLLAMLMLPREAVPVVILLQLGSSLMGARQSLQRWDREASIPIAAAAIVTTPLGVWLLHLVSADAARIGMALVTLSAVALLASGKLSVDRAGRWQALPFGLAAGVLGGASAMPGPPVIAYFMARDIAPAMSRASMNLIFLATSVAASVTNIVGGAMTIGTLFIFVLCAPAMILGTAIGARAFETATPKLYRRIGLGSLTAIAILAFGRVVLG